MDEYLVTITFYFNSGHVMVLDSYVVRSPTQVDPETAEARLVQQLTEGLDQALATGGTISSDQWRFDGGGAVVIVARHVAWCQAQVARLAATGDGPAPAESTGAGLQAA